MSPKVRSLDGVVCVLLCVGLDPCRLHVVLHKMSNLPDLRRWTHVPDGGQACGVGMGQSMRRQTKCVLGLGLLPFSLHRVLRFPPSVAVSVGNVESIIGVVLAVWVADADNEHEKRIHFLYTDIFKKVE